MEFIAILDQLDAPVALLADRGAERFQEDVIIGVEHPVAGLVIKIPDHQRPLLLAGVQLGQSQEGLNHLAGAGLHILALQAASLGDNWLMSGRCWPYSCGVSLVQPTPTAPSRPIARRDLVKRNMSISL